VNAAQQATDIALTSKIASAVSLFRSEFPDAKVDLKPWSEDSGTQELVDPDSIDFSFHFPGWSRRWQSRSVLVIAVSSGDYQRSMIGSLKARSNPNQK
jgi:hypothetical protein